MILDFSSQLDFLWALLPEVVVTVTALLVLLLDVFHRGQRSGSTARWIGWIALAGLVAAAAANGWLLTTREEGRTAMIAVDTFRITMNFVILGLAFLALLFSFDWLRREDLEIGEYYFLVLTATLGMMLLGGTRDLVVFFLALELMSISVYVLTGMNRSDPRSSEGALKYFLMGAFASGFLLYGIALLFGATGSLNLSIVASEVARGSARGDLLLLGGIAMLLIGLGFKVSAVPFHMWTPDAYQGAPTPVTAFMAAGVKAAGFAAIVRFVMIGLAPASGAWEGVVWWLALLTMIVPNLIALAQDDVKRLLAYSSIAHAGYLLVGVASANEMGRSATVLYLAVYGLMTLGSFAVVYAVAGRGDAHTRLSDYRGLGWRRPVLGAAMVIFLLSLAGFPPTGGFIGKLYLLLAAVEAGQIALAIVLVLTSLVSYYYYLRVIWKMYFEQAPEDAPAPSPLGGAFRVAAVLAAAGILLIGIFPGPALRTAGRAGGDLVAPSTPGLVSRAPAPSTASSVSDREQESVGQAR